MLRMTYNELIAHFGSEARAAAARDIPRQTVHRWKGREIPLDQQVRYEIVTNGALLADLPNEVRRRRKVAA